MARVFRTFVRTEYAGTLKIAWFVPETSRTPINWNAVVLNIQEDRIKRAPLGGDTVDVNPCRSNLLRLANANEKKRGAGRRDTRRGDKG